MPDKIYVTYSPTTVPESYHTAVHYERADDAGNVVQHHVIEAKPQNLNDLSPLDKVIGVVEEALRKDNGASRFGNIQASAVRAKSEDEAYPYEIIAEGPDLSENLARMELYATGVNRAGFAYRGDHQNSNTFATGALRAGGLPAATGVAHDPAGPSGELLDFFAPGLNEPLRAPIGQRASAGSVGGWRLSPTYTDEHLGYLGQPNTNKSSPLPYDPTNPPPLFAPSNYAAPSGNGSIDKWIASLTDADPDDPTQPDVPPLFSPFYRR